MKKLILTIAIIIGLSIGAFAQGGLFQYGEVSDDGYYAAWYALDQNNELQRDALMPVLPTHGQNNNQNAPLGSGALLLIGFSAAYALRKRKNYCE